MSRKLIKILLALCAAIFLLLTAVGFWAFMHKQTILDKAKEAIRQSLNCEVEIADFEFSPITNGIGLTFTFEGIILRDSLFATHRAPLLKADQLSVTFNLASLFSRQVLFRDIRLLNGEVFIMRRADGYSNLAAFSKADTTKTKGSGKSPAIFRKLKKLTLQNVSAVYADSLKEKYFGAVFRQVQVKSAVEHRQWTSDIQGSIFYDHLTLNVEKGSFLKKQETFTSLKLRFDEASRTLQILPASSLGLAGNESIGVTGTFDFSPDKKPLQLRFQTDRIRVPTATKLLSDTLAAKIERIGINAFVSAEAVITGVKGSPKAIANVSFVTDTFSYEIPVGFFRGMRAKGYFTNRLDSTQSVSKHNSEIRSEGITGFFEGIPITGNLKVTDFADPRTLIDFVAEADSASLNSIFDPDHYKVKQGKARLELRYQGSLKRFYDPDTDEINGSISGKAEVKNLALSYLPKNINLSRLNCDITFDEKDIVVRKLDVFDQQNQLYIHGHVERLLQNLLGSSRPAKAVVDINIPKWQMNWIKVLVDRTKKEKKKNNYRLSQIIDNTIDNLEIEATLAARQLRYYHFLAHNVKGKILIAQDGARLETFALDAFGGKVSASGNLYKQGGQHVHSFLDVKGKISQANVGNVFRSFDNFGQSTFTSENIKGRLDASFRFSSYLDNDVKLIPYSMSGELDFNFTGGNVINFAPFMKMKKLIFRNRSFEDVKFAPIQTKFKLKGQEIEISKMQIETNVLTLFLEGIYSFADKTDLSIQLPLQNLKKRRDDYQLQHYEPDSLKSIYLRAVDEGGEVNIKLDSKKTMLKRKQKRMTETDKPEK